MKAIIIGRNDALLKTLAAEFIHCGHECTIFEDRGNISDQEIDVCVDISAKGIKDVRQITNTLKKRNVHYILFSSYEVYPPVQRLSPWVTNEIDLCDETGFSTVDVHIRRYRAAERELKHQGVRGIPWTIVRPSIVEVKEEPDAGNMWWFVSRILDGGPIVLPDDDDPLFRHVADVDLARAIQVIAGNKEAYFQTVHVTGNTLLSFESYARLIMRVLDKKVPVVRIAGDRWRAAGLDLPMGKYLQSSFIEESSLLETLGWEQSDEFAWVKEYAEYLVTHPLKKNRQRSTELSLLEKSQEETSESIQYAEPEHWKLVGKPGETYSLKLETGAENKEVLQPLLRTRQLAMGMAEERFLIEPTPEKSPLILVHNAVLEHLEGDDTGLKKGATYIPVAQRPCGKSNCSVCTETYAEISGLTVDGFGAKYISVPVQHLIQVPTDIRNIALLADPLACLLSVLPSLLEEKTETVWVFGERIEALLAILLIKETGHSLQHVNRSRLATQNIPVDIPSMTLQRAQKKVQDTSLAEPTIAINLSGSIDGENLLTRALADEGILVTPFAATQTRRHRVNVRLPLVAPGRIWQEKALGKLRDWSKMYDLASFLRPVQLRHYHELFSAGQFTQCIVDLTGEEQ